MTHHGSTDQSDEILATRADFVPTALNTDSDDRLLTRCVDWQTAMRRAIRDPDELRRRLKLPPTAVRGNAANDFSGSLDGIEGGINFPTFVPLEFLNRMVAGDPCDPLLRQVLPGPEEQRQDPGFVSDPVGDLRSVAAPGLLHKYPGRALLVVTGACGVHCRYCFRREFPYHEGGGTSDRWDGAMEYLREHTEIDEVLLSGGDPLTLVDASLDRLIGSIESVRHIRRLRIHTRMPIVIPQRITRALIDRLSRSRLAIWFVVHANHPNELDEHVLDALRRLIDRGIPVLNQAVLLRGVNDDADTLVELCRRLVNHRVQPYYLHQLDRVRGAAHFEVPVDEGRKLIEQIRKRLPGYAVPTYVTEQPGEESKTVVG